MAAPGAARPDMSEGEATLDDRHHRSGISADVSAGRTSITVRENLVDILARELLGPIRGPQEVLPFSPRSQYLVGHLAPVKLTGAALIDDNAVQARANAEALAEGGGVPAYAADETTPTPTTTPKTAHPSRA